MSVRACFHYGKTVKKESKRKREKPQGRFAWIPSLSLLLSLCLSEPPAMLLMMLGAAALHEGGHLLLFYICTRDAPRIGFDRFGFRLWAARPLLPREELCIAAAGPLVNFLLALLFFRLRGSFFFSLGTVHLLLALFNLLPFDTSDGGRMLRIALASFLSADNAERATTFVSASVLSFFYFLSLYLFYFTGNGLSGVFFAVFSFPWDKVESDDDF